MWKAANFENYPVQIDGRLIRGVFRCNFFEPLTLNSFIWDTTRLWNKAPIKNGTAKTISEAKREIKSHCKTLPI